MKTPLVEIEITSIYKNKDGQRINLPKQFATPSPDTHRALVAIRTEVRALGGELCLSDLFRSHDMQLQAYLDYKSGKKKAFSPEPGGSMHESGRAFDLDLTFNPNGKKILVELKDFWDIAAKYGVKPIITVPKSTLSEAWHFDCPGSHQLVYDYYASKKASNMIPYRAMATSAILAAGIRVEMFKEKQKEAALQSGLIRLGFELGPIDGIIGVKTRTALEQAGIPFTTLDENLLAVEDQLQLKYPGEYQMIFPEADETTPTHLIP